MCKVRCVFKVSFRERLEKGLGRVLWGVGRFKESERRMKYILEDLYLREGMEVGLGFSKDIILIRVGEF